MIKKIFNILVLFSLLYINPYNVPHLSTFSLSHNTHAYILETNKSVFKYEVCAKKLFKDA